ncbi:ABC transporter permease [Thiobacter aerophilum]|uniref:MlaE family lipid ABC transporter permease subunit n=1 Tax=Thiobacter aerophilum TaxID=3121275 RepID=A0ABV0EEI6_9BURK
MRCLGHWTVQGIAGLKPRVATLAYPGESRLVVDCGDILAFDTAGAWLLDALLCHLRGMGREVELVGLAPERARLLELVQSRAARLPWFAPPRPPGWLARLGMGVSQRWQEAQGMLAFLGETTLSALVALREPRRWRGRLVLHHIQHAGLDALALVGLLAFLVGVVIAYQGATQLARYGANIFVVDLIAHAILRELGPMLVAIIVAGRSGSAFAAQIGTMKVSEEIDALRTLGLSPQEVLVLPRMLALALVLPLLTFYADVLGLLGGFVVARVQLDVDAASFLDRFDDTIRVSTFLFGVGKAPVFALIIALVGCYQGFRAAGSADSVGRHTTLSVVQSIFLIIIVDAVFSVLANVTRLGFR